jgi:Ca-activated chloride channel family protein
MAWLHPSYVWLLVVVPVVAGWYLYVRRERMQAWEAFGDTALLQELAATVRPGRRTVKAVLVVVGLALVVVSLAGPRFGTKVREVERKGVDLVVALDVSTSMRAEDVAPNRLERAKNEIKNVLNRLGGDRVGLVVFAGDGFVQCPLTTDYNAVRLFLDVADTDLIPTPGTNFRAAMQAAVQAFDTAADTTRSDPGPSARRSRALLVVSDGENHVGDLDAVKETARENRIALFTAGVGETGGATIPVYEQGSQVGVKRDRQGSVVRTRLDETSLTSLAEQGAYFRITRTSSALPDFREALRELEQTSFGAEKFSEYAEMYQWPLAAGLALLFLEMLIPARATASD